MIGSYSVESQPFDLFEGLAEELVRRQDVQMPTCAKVGPYEYRITRDAASMRKAEKADGCRAGSLAGVHSAIRRELNLDPDNPEQSQRETLLHEMIHAVHGLAGLEYCDDQGVHTKHTCEQFLDSTCPMLLDTLQRNPDVVRWLLGIRDHSEELRVAKEREKLVEGAYRRMRERLRHLTAERDEARTEWASRDYSLERADSEIADLRRQVELRDEAIAELRTGLDLARDHGKGDEVTYSCEWDLGARTFKIRKVSECSCEHHTLAGEAAQHFRALYLGVREGPEAESRCQVVLKQAFELARADWQARAEKQRRGDERLLADLAEIQPEMNRRIQEAIHGRPRRKLHRRAAQPSTYRYNFIIRRAGDEASLVILYRVDPKGRIDVRFFAAEGEVAQFQEEVATCRDDVALRECIADWWEVISGRCIPVETLSKPVEADR